MENSLQADIALLEIHIRNTVNGEQLDNLTSLPHVLLLGLFRRVYFDHVIITEINNIQEINRIAWTKQNAK